MEPNQQPVTPEIDAAAGRLDSWKDIAAYLRRDVRTVQRWHDRAGLPVHRHVDARQRGVFAFRTELDAWANQSRASAEDGPAGENAAVDGRPRNLKIASWLVAGILFVSFATAVAWTLRPQSHPSVQVHERAWVLVAAFDNHTGDEMLDESLQFVLERELSASPVISVVPRPRVQDVLLLMRRAADTRVTPALAREIALRDGGVHAIVTGRVDPASPGYLLTVEIIDSSTGSRVTSRSRQVSARPALLAEVRQLAAWARDSLGEVGRMARPDSRLPQVTTTSLGALQLYAEAEDALSRNQGQAARVLLESALREDPEFALAHSRLAGVLMNDADVRTATPLIKEHEERALELSARATERERLNIVGTYQFNHRQIDKALAPWEALSRIDPNDWVAHSRLSGLYYNLGRLPEALRAARRVAELRPNDFATVVGTAQTLVLWGDDLNGARAYVERARALWPAQQNNFASEVGRANLPPWAARAAAWMFLFPAYERWRAGDVQGMLREVQQVLDANHFPAPVDRDALLTIALSFEMSVGRLNEARRLAELMFQERLRELHFAVLADAVDDTAALRRHMLQVPPDGEERALRLVRAGLYPQAESVMARNSGNKSYTETARGELALRRGRVTEAVAALQRGVAAGTRTLSERYLGAESLADALERLNRHDEALSVLEAAAAAEPRYNPTGPSGAFWLRVLNRLSRAYRDRGRAAQAVAVDARLTRLLALADADHPLVLQLARRNRADMAHPPRAAGPARTAASRPPGR